MSRCSAIRPFNASGFEVLTDDISTRGEAAIFSTGIWVPRLGDTFLLDRSGQTYEAAVSRVTAVAGGWHAHCRCISAI